MQDGGIGESFTACWVYAEYAIIQVKVTLDVWSGPAGVCVDVHGRDRGRCMIYYMND